MNKISTLLIASCLLALNAKPQNWAWAKSSQGSLFTPIDVSSDPSGNSYTIGQFQGTMIINGNPYTSNGGSDVYLIKRDINGNVIWVKIVGGSNNEFAGKIETGINGKSVFYLSVPQGPDVIPIGYDTVTIGTNGGSVIAKIDATGSFNWSLYFDGQAYPKDVTVDDSGDIYIAGSMDGTVALDNVVFNNNATSSFVGMMSSSGNLNWAKKFYGLTTGSVSFASGIAVDHNDNIIVSGAFLGTVMFGSNNVFTSSTTNYTDGYLLKMYSNGNTNWAKHLHGGGSFDSTSVAVDLDGDPIIVGHIDGFAWFDDTTMIWSLTQSVDMFIAKYEVDGDLEWARLAGGISADGAKDVEVDASGRIYIAGYFGDVATFNYMQLYSSAGKDGFIAKYNNNGQILWVKSIQGDATEQCKGISARNYNGIYVAGSGPVNGQLSFDTITISNSPGSFTALLMDDCINDSLNLNVIGNQMICQGDSLYLEADGGYVNYWWSTGETTQGIYATTSGSYSCVAMDTMGCKLTSPTIDLVAVNNYFIPELCIVTVDTSSSRNIVVWEKPQVNFLDSFRIYREVSNQYYHIGSVPYDSLSQFVDTTDGINPQITSYRYKVSSVDNCGNESALSDFHETIHLTTNAGTNGEVNLIWDDYIGFGVSVYKIYRDSTGQGNFELIDSVSFSNFTYTDLNPPTGSVSYIIEVVPPQVCVATRSVNYHSSRSNEPPAMQTGMPIIDANGAGFVAFPNPARTLLTVASSVKPEEITGLQLYNTQGQLMADYHPSSFPYRMDISALQSGVYQIRMLTVDGVFNRMLVKY